MDRQNIIDAHPGQTWPEGRTITTQVERTLFGVKQGLQMTASVIFHVWGHTVDFPQISLFISSSLCHIINLIKIYSLQRNFGICAILKTVQLLHGIQNIPMYPNNRSSEFCVNMGPPFVKLWIHSEETCDRIALSRGIWNTAFFLDNFECGQCYVASKNISGPLML